MAASDGSAVGSCAATLLRGLVIPAHPLALTETRALDERRQVALTRYYCDAGAGGIAVGVHTTQFAIRDPAVGLFEPVLAARAAGRCATGAQGRAQRPVMIAGRVRVRPARPCARRSSRSSLGYDAALLSLAALRDAGNRDAARSLPARRGGHPARRVLPAARGRRTRPRPGVLARLPRDRARRRDQGRAVRSLPHARRHDRRWPRAGARTSRSTRATTTPSWPIC